MSQSGSTPGTGGDHRHRFADVRGELPVLFSEETSGARGSAARVYFQSGRAARPHIPLPYEVFERYFAQHRSPADTHAGDLYLACACAEGVGAAILELEDMLTGEVAHAVENIDASSDFVEEVLQATRERLLVAKNGEPGKIASYAGRASLKNWLCAVCVRCALSQRRRKSGHLRLFGGNTEAQLVKAGPELEYLRRRYKGAFEGAVRVAMDQLAPREKMLLRLNIVDGMSVDQLGALYRVGRSTAARWLAAARYALLDQARRELCSTLGLTHTELESLAKDVRSQLELNIADLLVR